MPEHLRPVDRAVQRDDSLSRWERRLLLLLVGVFVVFGGLFELRSALQQTRKGDLDVFLRAAWAVRAGDDIYTATDDNEHHYHYPPFLAILLVPLADPPAGYVGSARVVPFAVSVAVWYVLSLALLALALNVLASALEEALYSPADRPEQGSRRWWALRVVPLLACLPAIGGALMRGQVDMILLVLFAAMAAAALRRQSLRAGFFLAVAMSIKVIPAFLLIYPIVKRDVRWLAGSAAGLALCLGVVPILAFGPEQTLAYYRAWHHRIARPGLTSKGDQTRAGELTRVTVTDSQSFMSVIHNTWHGRHHRCGISLLERRLHWGIGGILTLVLLTSVTTHDRRERPDAAAPILALGLLIVLMALLSPVCHLHYFSLAVPLTMGILAMSWQRRGQTPLLTPPLLGLLAFNIVANAVPRIPGFGASRDYCLATYAALALWATGVGLLWIQPPRSDMATSVHLPPSRVAA